MPFSQFGLHPDLLRGVKEMGFTRPTPIQNDSIPPAMEGRDVLACGPEPMLEAVRALVPDAQLAWEAPMACGYGACYGCVVEIDGALERLCLEGPVLDGARVRAHAEAVA